MPGFSLPTKPAQPVLAVCLMLLSAFFLLSCDDGARNAKVPKEVPNFSLTTLDNQTLTRDGLKGKVVLLDFWATWCAPCRAAIPHLAALYENYREQGLEVIGISLDQGGVSEVENFVSRNRVPYPIVFGVNNPIAKDLGNISSLPTIILLNQDSAIEFKVIGFNAEIGQQMENKIKKLLAPQG
ncbi:MAG: TlpA family protein disulfide reductase [Deltaproteobacteria bacterium]|nr:TlpA family protein disulfide reductase [Deltaproteobacteria bacterium]